MQERTPLHRALTRPNLFLGADRELVLCTAILLGFVCVMTLANLWLFILTVPCAFLFWFLVIAGLRIVAHHDPLYRQVYIRSIRYQKIIPHASTPFRSR